MWGKMGGGGGGSRKSDNTTEPFSSPKFQIEGVWGLGGLLWGVRCVGVESGSLEKN